MPVIRWYDLPWTISTFERSLPENSMHLSTTKRGLKWLATLFFGNKVLPLDGNLEKGGELKDFSWKTFWASPTLDKDQKQYASFDPQVQYVHIFQDILF